MKSYTFLLILLALCVSTTSVFAQKGSTSVTSAFEDTYSIVDTSGTSTSYYHSLRSDGRSYINGTESVGSVIQGIGDWELDMSSSATRRVFFDFGSEIIGTNTTGISLASSAYPTRFLAQCSVRGIKLQNLKVGDPAVYCPVNAKILNGSSEYSIRFRKVEFPGTNDVAWTCTSMTIPTATVPTPKCNGWRMESADDGSIARLLQLTTVKGKITTKEGSLYKFKFKVNLTAP